MNEQWIQQMRQKMTGYKRPAPEVSWEEIEQALAADKAHRSRLIWLRGMAAAAVFLLIAGVGYWSRMHNDPKPIIGKHVVQELPITENHRDQIHNQADNQDHRADPELPVQESQDVTPFPATGSDTVKTVVADNKKQSHHVEEKAKPVESLSPVLYPSDLRQQKHPANRLTARVYMSSTMAESHHVESFYNPSGAFTGTFYSGESMQTTVSHRQPLRFGLSLRYRLNDHWSLESGLTYTYLSSDIATTVDGVTALTEQHIYYIGLPLDISYDLWKNRHFGFYVTAGGIIEKRLDASPWQFSLNGAVGTEYKLTDIFSLYVEPGLGYYFKDGSSTSTIYQDHPLNFNLSFGLRFNLK